uniref:Uncharacterized protein n=1 Tax=Acrobeloides nanus TaxID=290746 RepID=A0A914EJF1_9BILA
MPSPSMENDVDDEYVDCFTTTNNIIFFLHSLISKALCSRFLSIGAPNQQERKRRTEDRGTLRHALCPMNKRT